MQLMVWGLSEGGAVIGKTIRDKDWEEHEKNGYVKNPFELPETEARLAQSIANEKKEQLKHVESIKSKLEEVGDTEDKSYEDVCKSAEMLEAEIKDKEENKTLSQRELNQFGEMSKDLVEVENFLLNLPSERSKKKVIKFLKSKGVECDESLTLKPLKKFAKEALSGD